MRKRIIKLPGKLWGKYLMQAILFLLIRTIVFAEWFNFSNAVIMNEWFYWKHFKLQKTRERAEEKSEKKTKVA
jgi:hypothetical protein